MAHAKGAVAAGEVLRPAVLDEFGELAPHLNHPPLRVVEQRLVLLGARRRQRLLDRGRALLSRITVDGSAVDTLCACP